MSSRAITMSEMSSSSAYPGPNGPNDTSLVHLRAYPPGGPGGPGAPGSAPNGAHDNQQHRPDLVITPLSARILEDSRMRGFGTRSIDLGSIPTIDGRILYELRALLFARRGLVSLAIPALPDAAQVYCGVEIPSLLELTLRCARAEEEDIIGAMQAFADSSAHARVTTLRIDSATTLPRALGRLTRNSRLLQFLSNIRFFSLSGRDIPRPREGGLRRELFRFAAAMPRLRKFEYGGYVPGLPAFQAVRAVIISAHALEELTVAQGAPSGYLREDAHLHRELCKLNPASGLVVDLHLRAALGKPETAALAGTLQQPAGPHFRRLDLTLTPLAVRELVAVCRANATTLRDLRVTALPAPDSETPAIWSAFASAVAEAQSLEVVHFAPVLARIAPRNAAARVLQEARTAVEVRVHAPGAAAGADAREAYIAALRAAEGCARLRRLWLCVDTGPVDEDVAEARKQLIRKAGSPVAVELGKGVAGDGEYETVKLVNPALVRWLWPARFLLTPWLSDVLITLFVAVIMAAIGAAAVAIAYYANDQLKKGT